MSVSPSSPQADGPGIRGENSAGAKRTTQACERCRGRKVRCSGTKPCNHCKRAKAECVFTEASKRISISTRYLRQLQEQAQSQSHRHGQEAQPRPARPTPSSPPRTPRPSTSRTVDASASDTTAEPHRDQGFERNPLVDGAHLVRDTEGTRGQQWYLGPSSTWSFSRRVIAYIEQNTSPSQGSAMPVNLDGAAYSLTWKTPWHSSVPLSRRDVPSLDYSIYLLNTVKFYMNQIFRFVDEKTFTERMYTFYDETNDAVLPTLWYSQFLFVLAFGKAFLTNVGSRSSLPKGWTHASQAFALLPSFHEPDQDNLLAIEVFCLAALYLQSIDMRVSAFEFVGRALRLCYVVGIHNDHTCHGNDEGQLTRSAHLWWSVYMLDQHLSALMGAPSAVQDDDVTVPLPSSQHSDCRAAALGTNVRLSRILARLVRSVYNLQATLDGSFLMESQAVLRSLADISWDVHNTVGLSSRLSSHMILCYHHCIVLATRPVVMCILARFIRNLDTSTTHREPKLSTTVTSLLNACTDSASTILRRLHSLNQESLLETFLPFHLEQAFSSALVLYIVSAIWTDNDYAAKDVVSEILHTMIAGGHNLASLRKSELDHLAALLARVNPSLADHHSAHTISPYETHGYPTQTASDGSNPFDSEFVWHPEHNANLAELAGILNFDSMDAQIMFPTN